MAKPQPGSFISKTFTNGNRSYITEHAEHHTTNNSRWQGTKILNQQAKWFNM